MYSNENFKIHVEKDFIGETKMEWRIKQKRKALSAWRKWGSAFFLGLSQPVFIHKKLCLSRRMSGYSLECLNRKCRAMSLQALISLIQLILSVQISTSKNCRQASLTLRNLVVLWNLKLLMKHFNKKNSYLSSLKVK